MKARPPSFLAKALLAVAPSLSPKRLAGCRRTAGFSLIEVNVAILVIAGGMLSLFTLFPAGLRMSTAAMSDTRQALFADDFFSFFDAGVSSLSLAEWQDVDDFWDGARDGLMDGFDIGESDVKEWKDPNEAILNSWDPDLKKSDFSKDGTPTLRFYKGKVGEYFSESRKTGKLDAEFIVRIASDFKHEDENGQRTHALDDGLVWRVSLVVSDEENSWFYDNSVYHRDFRYAELP